jgi:transcriptional activator SPT8
MVSDKIFSNVLYSNCVSSASHDILRLYDLKDQGSNKHSVVPFLIIPGHRTGVISQLYMDPSCTFLISTAGNRGWEGSSTEVLLGYEIGTTPP